MNPNRALMWMAGIVLLLAGIYMLYFQANLSRWVSLGIVSAGVLLVVGLAVMSFASTAPDRQEPRVIETAHHEGRVVPVKVQVNNRRDP